MDASTSSGTSPASSATLASTTPASWYVAASPSISTLVRLEPVPPVVDVVPSELVLEPVPVELVDELAVLVEPEPGLDVVAVEVVVMDVVAAEVGAVAVEAVDERVEDEPDERELLFKVELFVVEEESELNSSVPAGGPLELSLQAGVSTALAIKGTINVARGAASLIMKLLRSDKSEVGLCLRCTRRCGRKRMNCRLANHTLRTSRGRNVRSAAGGEIQGVHLSFIALLSWGCVVLVRTRRLCVSGALSARLAMNAQPRHRCPRYNTRMLCSTRLGTH
jgi:hypothetical protein